MTLKETQKWIGRRIREDRQLAEMSLGELSKASGISKGNLSKVENGINNPCVETLYRVTTALGRDMGWLFP